MSNTIVSGRDDAQQSYDELGVRIDVNLMNVRELLTAVLERDIFATLDGVGDHTALNLLCQARDLVTRIEGEYTEFQDSSTLNQATEAA